MSHGFNEARVKVAHPYLTMMGLYLGGFTGMFSETCLNIALPQLGVAFGVDTAITQWLVIGYMLVIGLVMPFASILMKWFFVRKLTLFSLGAFIAGSLVSGCAPTFEVLLFGRLVQGIGTGLVLPMMFSMVLEVFPPCKIGAAMGVTALIIMFAPAIGPTLSGILLGIFSWRAIFFSFVVVLVVGVAFASKFLVDPYELTRPSVDALSCVLSCIGFGGLVLGVGLASSYGWASAQVLAPLACGIVALVWYARRQLMIDVPIINVRIFGIRGFVLGGAAMMINFGITLSAMFLLPQFIQNAMGVAVAMTGIIMLPGGIVNAIVSMLAGRLYDRVGARIPARIGFALSIAGSIMLLLAMESSTIAYVIVAHIVLMIGVPLAMSPCQTSALNSLPPQLSADGSTALNAMQQVLGAIATAVATSLLGLGQASYYAAGGTSAAEGFTAGSHWGFAFTFVLAVCGLLVALMLKQRAEKTDVVPEMELHEMKACAPAQPAGER